MEAKKRNADEIQILRRGTYTNDVFDAVGRELLVQHVEFGVSGGPELGFAGGGVVDAVLRLLLLLVHGVLDGHGPLILHEETVRSSILQGTPHWAGSRGKVVKWRRGTYDSVLELLHDVSVAGDLLLSHVGGDLWHRDGDVTVGLQNAGGDLLAELVHVMGDFLPALHGRHVDFTEHESEPRQTLLGLPTLSTHLFLF